MVKVSFSNDKKGKIVHRICMKIAFNIVADILDKLLNNMSR